MGSLLKRKRTFKKKGTVLARGARRRNTKLVASLRQELKFFDTTVSFNYDSTSEVPSTGQWALIPQGDTASSRDGRQCRVKSIMFRGHAQWIGTTAWEGSYYLWVVLDRQANGAAAAATDVFTSASAQSCHINLNNSRRFKILHKVVLSAFDHGSTATVQATDQSGLVHIPVEFYIPCDILMNFNSTAGAISEITENNIFIIAGAAGNVVDDFLQLTGQARVRFIG